MRLTHSARVSLQVVLKLTSLYSVIFLSLFCVLAKQATEAGTDGQMTYRDQDELRMPLKGGGPPQKKVVEQVLLVF